MPLGAPLADGSVMPAPPPGATATLADGTVVPANAIMAAQLRTTERDRRRRRSRSPCVGGEEDPWPTRS